MTTPDQPGGNRKDAKRIARVKRPAPARSGPIRSGKQLPGAQPIPAAQASQAAQPSGPSPREHAYIHLDEGMINEEVASAVRTANQVLSDTVAQGRVAAELFRRGDYNVRDVPVDLEILGKRVLKLTRELSDTTLNILEQLLKQITQTPTAPPAGLKGSVPPFPMGRDAAQASASDAPPSSYPAPAPAPDNQLNLNVRFVGKAKARALPSPLWKPSLPTLPKQLSITSMQHLTGKAAPITDVAFEADLSGKLIVTITIPAKQPRGVYSGMVVPDNAHAPLGVLTIEIMA